MVVNYFRGFMRSGILGLSILAAATLTLGVNPASVEAQEQYIEVCTKPLGKKRVAKFSIRPLNARGGCDMRGFTKTRLPVTPGVGATSDFIKVNGQLVSLSADQKNLIAQINSIQNSIAGIQSAQGVAGPKGDKGDRGEKGEQGIAGAPGATGATGATGPKGDKGDAGSILKLSQCEVVTNRVEMKIADGYRNDARGIIDVEFLNWRNGSNMGVGVSCSAGKAVTRRSFTISGHFRDLNNDQKLGHLVAMNYCQTPFIDRIQGGPQVLLSDGTTGEAGSAVQLMNTVDGECARKNINMPRHQQIGVDADSIYFVTELEVSATCCPIDPESLLDGQGDVDGSFDVGVDIKP